MEVNDDNNDDFETEKFNLAQEIEEELEQSNTHFYLVMCRTRKKLDKYFKNNRIRNKQIIDIRKLVDEEEIDFNIKNNVAFFKLLIINKIKVAKQKEKDIYYIPNFSNHDLNIKSLLNLRNNIEYNTTFNLLLFYDEFIGTNWIMDILEDIDVFDNSQILKDY